MEKERKKLLLTVMLMCYLIIPFWVRYSNWYLMLAGPLIAGFFAGIGSSSIRNSILACLLASGVSTLVLSIVNWSLDLWSISYIYGYFLVLLIVGVMPALAFRELYGSGVPFRSPSTH